MRTRAAPAITLFLVGAGVKHAVLGRARWHHVWRENLTALLVAAIDAQHAVPQTNAELLMAGGRWVKAVEGR